MTIYSAPSSPKATILIAEDEARISLFLCKGLIAEGYAVRCVSLGAEVIRGVHDATPDLLLLDLGLPDCDGLIVLKELRRQGYILPVIILTARVEPGDQIAGLDGGANDYLCKPFRFSELLARIRAHLRTAQLRSTLGHVDESNEWLGARESSVRLHRPTRMAHLSATKTAVELTNREFLLLELFLKSPNVVLSRETLLSRVWDYDHDPGTNVLDVYIRYLRRKIGSDLIETVRGVGYRLSA